MWGIIGAMESEILLLRGKMQQECEICYGNKKFYQGILNGQAVVLTQSGMGKVNAAMCAQMLIDRFGVDRLVNTGIAGGIARELHVGDIVIGTASLQHDFDLTPIGYAKACMRGPDKTKPTLFFADKALVEEFRLAARNVLPEEKIHEGLIVTGDVFVSNREVKLALRKNYNAYAAEMEGGAIAQVAEENGIAAVIVRSISDLADDYAQKSVENFEQSAADLSAQIILCMLENCNKMVS